MRKDNLYNVVDNFSAFTASRKELEASAVFNFVKACSLMKLTIIA